MNVNLIDKNKKLIHENGYRFSNNESNYSTPQYLTKKYIQFLRTFGLTQLIKEPTRITDKT